MYVFTCVGMLKLNKHQPMLMKFSTDSCTCMWGNLLVKYWGQFSKDFTNIAPTLY